MDEAQLKRDGDMAGLAADVLGGDRRALARAITLVESTRPDHRADADALLSRLLPETGGSARIGITGVPGVGKSTLIESLGLHLTEAGHRVAVLAVDPSSQRSGGSILGDKTRMDGLARAGAAFIRPSPTGGTLGGVARRTREALLICEAAGFDVVVVETVGVGQSETAVADMVDAFLLLLLPGGGDELQGLKRGIVELADIVVVNKSDGDLAAIAERTAADFRNALHFYRPRTPGWAPPVMQCSALTGDGVAAIWETIAAYRAALGGDGIAALRAAQARGWLWKEVGESLVAALRRSPAAKAMIDRLEAEVATGATTPSAAAAALLGAFLGAGASLSP